MAAGPGSLFGRISTGVTSLPRSRLFGRISPNGQAGPGHITPATAGCRPELPHGADCLSLPVTEDIQCPVHRCYRLAASELLKCCGRKRPTLLSYPRELKRSLFDLEVPTIAAFLDQSPGEYARNLWKRWMWPFSEPSIPDSPPETVAERFGVTFTSLHEGLQVSRLVQERTATPQRSKKKRRPRSLKLTVREKQLFSLAEEGWNNGDIAREIGCTKQYVSKTLKRAREKVKSITAGSRSAKATQPLPVNDALGGKTKKPSRDG